MHSNLHTVEEDGIKFTLYSSSYDVPNTLSINRVQYAIKWKISKNIIVCFLRDTKEIKIIKLPFFINHSYKSGYSREIDNLFDNGKSISLSESSKKDS